MSNENSKQPDHEKSPTYPLVGNEHFTQEERADFLAKARQQEAEYDSYLTELKNGRAVQSPNVYLPTVDDDEHKFRNPNHPVNVKQEIYWNTRLEHALTARLNDPEKFPWRHHIESHLREVQDKLHENRTRLEAYYQENPHKRPTGNAIGVTESGKQLEAISAKWEGSAWHKQHVDPKQPLQFTEAFKRVNALERRDHHVPEIKPYEADALRGAEALYTHGKENKHLDPSSKNTHLNPYQQPISESQLKHASKYALLAMGLLGATEAAKADSGDLMSKLNAAKEVLKETALEAVPGVTFFEKMRAGKYQEASLDAASYLPLGDITAFSRTPEVQSVIDKLPNTPEQLQNILSDQCEAPINRHMAEYQLRLIEAKDSGDVLKGLTVIDRLTDLAEKKIIMQMQWSKKSSDYAEVVKTPDPNWPAIMKRHPEIAPQIAIHVAAVNSGHPKEFVEQIDANITSALAAGRLLTPTLSLEQLKQTAHSIEDSAQMAELENSH